MSVLPLPNDDFLSPITAVPGLYASNRTAASSPSKLTSQGITHIVAVLEDDELSFRKDSQEEWRRFKTKQIAVWDDDNEDILFHLDDVCLWIDQALSRSRDSAKGNDFTSGPKNKVLIHCRQGVSRSGAFVVGYIMKKLSLSYSNALQVARSSREAVSPNPGFEKQLRIWEHCNYDIYVPEAEDSTRDQTPSPEPVSSPGPDRAEFQLTANGHTQRAHNRTPKAAYKAWKKERDSQISSNGNNDHPGSISMASLAAEFDKRKLETKQKLKEKATVAATPASAPVLAASDDPKRQSSSQLPVSRSQAKRCYDDGSDKVKTTDP